MEEKTIVGIASAAGGGIGIIRVSGSESMKIVDSIFHPGKFNNEENEALIDKSYLQQQKSHTIHYGFIIDGNNEVVDEVMVSVMKAPATYTREDVVEINCHGGNYILQRVMQLLLEKGAFLAEPGEFTKRAFLNGRIDLSQAEAVMKMISSKNEFALQSAVKQLEGSVSKYIQQIREQILYEMGRIESALDDPEHYDLTGYSDELFDKTEQQIVSLQRLLDRFENGRMKSEGINTVIVGKPNAGKSSLMNILLDEDRAIVTDIAGTTRDALQESVRLGGLMLNLIDTAGIHNTEDTVEKIGVDRAKQYIEQADFILFVVDGSEEWSDEDEQILPLIAQKKGIILLNKADLKVKVSELFLKDKLSWDTIAFSNETKQGLQQLEQYITDKFERGDLQFNDQICLTSIRHKNAVMQAVNALHRVEQSIKDGMPEDFFTIDLMEAYQQLGLINGDTATEDLVNKIFEEFCMGK
ncbi:tRNA uridine-5-carboxymethylaminomethyl(34) synthesis GTPase MnmE [Clostridium sp. OM05-6BH]|jgi:tRNA modification GTPase|uniref:tRNA uridine-5-carboxymethylaminomethyl(34) synthesis GTPase MnmE n=1 Tax=unclassified Clostridium TaxID=2614128 RepID=UPI000E48A6E3|nr:MULTISPECIES: tRNA uridine-5-carboxymethylaminomethyl(34) synthesis GTPase MnmE [unclassified Clostridium]RHV12242.1 tRNA uridine-5-carboxymethylaminomethyl(34) synthesis GTPase MnmE [Clostridium sp. OM05-9BH]RHV17883.1 tRNA uridine-5-carboxymethylaminomethyl(34) synthesis GTPase MnmE [Clostridium sp. OM05-6BH]